jgi:sugar lactone lactonase YvrE
MGTPDGMTIDNEGMLWIAHWGGFGVYRWDPFTGELLSKIEVQAPNVTSCRFAGKNLDQLVITTARKNMSEIELQHYPESGNVFSIKTDHKGLKQNKCCF